MYFKILVQTLCSLTIIGGNTFPPHIYIIYPLIVKISKHIPRMKFFKTILNGFDNIILSVGSSP